MEQFHEYACRDRVHEEEKISSEELLLRAMRVHRKPGRCQIGWFDGSGIWQSASFRDAKEAEDFCESKGIVILHRYQDEYYTTPGMIDGVRVHMVYMCSAIRSLSDGDTLADLIGRYNTLLDSHGDYKKFYKVCGIEHVDLYDGYDLRPSAETRDFVMKINTPSIERYAGNLDVKTFDLVRIRLGIKASMPKQEQARFAKAHMRELVSIAKAKINESKRYQKYEVPLEFLELDHASVTNQGEIELVFVLPDIR